MGFFSKYNKVEGDILDLYTKMLSDSGLPNAKATVQEWLDSAIEDSKREGMYTLTGVGDRLLEKEKIDGKTKEKFEIKRKEGVRDEDIRWWFNLDDIERRMMLKVDMAHISTLFISELDKGKIEDDADKTVRKYHPIYGDLNDESHGTGDNRPLPFELKDRINIYIEKQGINNPEYKEKIEKSSTFNALVREEIRSKNI